MHRQLSDERFRAFHDVVKKYYSWEAILADAGITNIADKDQQYEITCPFHEDKRPSMRLTKSTGVYHCFSCGRKGTYPKFLWELSGASVPYSQFCEQILKSMPGMQQELHFTSLFISEGSLDPAFNQRRVFDPKSHVGSEMPLTTLVAKLRKMDDSWNSLAVSLSLLQQGVPPESILVSMEKRHISIKKPEVKINAMDLLGD